MNEEILKKVKEAKSPEELLNIARENGLGGFTEEKAKAYFDLMNQKTELKSGELSDEELDVSAGGCDVMSSPPPKKPDPPICWRCNVPMQLYDFDIFGSNTLYLSYKCTNCNKEKDWKILVI